MNALVSVIIPTYNAEKDILRCLKSIMAQTYRPIEVIVVDQSSRDKTIKIAEKFTDKIIKREEPEFYSPPAKSRNIGVKNSKGRFLLNIDADMDLPPKLIESCVKEIIESKSVGLIIHEDDVALNFWAKCRALEKFCMRKDPYMEAARFTLRKAFIKINGYDDSLGSGEDWDLNARLKEIGKIGYSPIALKHHTGKKRLISNFKKMFLYGRTFDKYIKKHPSLSKKQLTPFREMYFRKWKTLARHPFLTAGLVILKFSEFSGAFLGLLYKKFT